MSKGPILMSVMVAPTLKKMFKPECTPRVFKLDSLFFCLSNWRDRDREDGGTEQAGGRKVWLQVQTGLLYASLRIHC